MSLPIVGPGPTLPPEEVAARIERAIPGAKVEVTDLTGTRDHYKVRVVSEAFEGLRLIQQHRMIKDALKEELKGPIHALTIETDTP